MATENPQEQLSPVAKLLIVINRIGVKAFQAKSEEALKFIILNDTFQVIRYDRAVLWDVANPKAPKSLGISGHASIKEDTEAITKWAEVVKSLKDPRKVQQVNESQLSGHLKVWNEVKSQSNSSVLWIPIFVKEKLALGLWLERWNSPKEYEVDPTVLELFSSYLQPVYSSAWEKFHGRLSLKKLTFSRLGTYFLAAALILGLFGIRLPMRIVAPCEVIPKDPILITAPLEGIIEQIIVKPGQVVKKGEILYEYDKRQPLQNLKIAQNEVQIMQAEVNRASTLGLSDKRSLTELATLTLKLEKEKINLDLAEYQASRLEGHAPENGIIILDNPDEWRGKPVKIGEKIMKVTAPDKTKVRIWLAESDNIPLDFSIPLKIFLNIRPDVTEEAKLTYIANESIIDEHQVPSFIADAEWVEQPEGVKLGLKGSAILYGERVSLFYFLMRKPLANIRHFLKI